ncbi:hypothetical protein LSAT2_024635 [Lamellibrachia satsuma]|nr:hypothetical protein LSAT2_024635 [Lamellibrachia satsuma]
MVSARKYQRYTAEEVLEMVDVLDSPSDFEIEETSDDELSVQDSLNLSTTAVVTDNSDDDEGSMQAAVSVLLSVTEPQCG